mgnify:CR=1 FL=1
MDNQKRIERLYKDKIQRIDRAIASKEKSIAYMNSVNSAIQVQTGNKFNWKQFVKDRNKFYELWQEWYLENMAIEPKKLTREDFIEAQEQAPESQAVQEKAEELGEIQLKEDNEVEANKLLDFASSKENA